MTKQLQTWVIGTLMLLATLSATAQNQRYDIRGRVISQLTRQGIPFATVVVQGQPTKGVAADSTGYFTIERVAPGIFCLYASSVGYQSELTMEYQINEATSFIEIELQGSIRQIDDIVVRPKLFGRVVESPVSMRRIGIQEIEKSPGANRDVSRIVQNYPGVSFSPAGYRNDLIVRGGSPSENRFFLDGIEIPNINHFSTQGASGGPVSIINADLIRSIDFYTGAFPANRGGALSSYIDLRLRDGDPQKQSFKATLGASEVALSGTGHIDKSTQYLFSVRQSYLQLLFKLLGLPFLPNFIDAQFKVTHTLPSGDRLMLLALTGIDDMTLNEEGNTPTADYILSYLPTIQQQTYTIGLQYKHFDGPHTQTISLSHSYIANQNTKYQDNNTSSEDLLRLKLLSREQKSTLRGDLSTQLDGLILRYGGEAWLLSYFCDSFSRTLIDNVTYAQSYTSSLGLFGAGLFASATASSANERLTATLGLRLDGCNFSSATVNLLKQTSPRISLAYDLAPRVSLIAATGLYFQLPPYTALSYKDSQGTMVNQELGYMRVMSSSLGAEWRPEEGIFLSMEGFYKKYGALPLSIEDQIPLADKGNDYGTIGNEALTQSAQGRSYGIELLARWQIPARLSAVSSLTLFRSEYRNTPQSPYISSSWDNQLLFNASATYFMNNGWSLGAKLCATGGTPVTPYDLDKSALVQYWQTTGTPAKDYTLYNTQRLDSYAQLDIRIDKSFYFEKWMLGIYIDIQNISQSKYRQPDLYVSTGQIANPTAPLSEQRYIMEFLSNIDGTMIPTIGLTAEF